MYKFFSIVCCLFMVACDNSVTNNSGAIPPVEFTGSVWASNVRYAKVQFVGIDQYGQLNRKADGSFYGDYHCTDDNGQFSASIQGAYVGSLIAVASYHDGCLVETVPATGDTPAVTESKSTEIRCVLPDGCKNESGEDVAYGDWFAAPTDFEMWGGLSFAAGLETFNVSPATHLAAKLAFSDFISDGSDCNPADPNTCLGINSENTIFTPESISAANQRLKQFFLLTTGLHINVQPWHQELIAEDTVAETESAKHGLISMALQQFSTDRNESMMDTLDWWVESFLIHDGNFYNDATTDYPTQVDYKNILIKIADVASAYDSEGSLGSSSLSDAAAAFASSPLAGSDKTLLSFTELEFDQDTKDRIIAAQAMVSKIQNWALNFENPPADGSGDIQYSAFFDDAVATEILATEDEWAKYNQALSPVMKNLLRPIIKAAEYGLTCIRPDDCDTAHDIHALSGVVFDTENDRVTINTSGNADFDGDVHAYSRLNLIGEFNSDLTQEEGIKTFSFTQASIETAEGEIDLLSADGALPTVVFWLDEALATGQAPQVSRVVLSIPELLLISKTTPEYQFKTSEFNVDLVGTRDQVSLVNGTSEFHYNILSSNISGKFSEEGGETGDSMDMRFTLNSENALTYYSPNRFPDIEMNVDTASFKSYANFEGDASAFIENQGGWFTLPANISQAEIDTPQTLTGDEAVTFFDRGLYASWGDEYDLLKELLNIDNSATAKLGTLKYPGGETALVIFKTDSTQTTEVARQCNRVGDVWGCQAALQVSSLGCGTSYSQGTATIIEAFNYLQSESCLSQVKIDGRGIYEIDYSVLGGSFTDSQSFDITLDSVERLGIESFYLRLTSKFVDGSGEKRPTAMMILNGSAVDMENVTLGFSLTHGYIGGDSSSFIGLDGLIPYGDNSIWLAVGQSAVDQDALIYYIQDANVTFTVFGFDYGDVDTVSGETISYDQDRDEPMASIRYDGQLLGSLRKEGDLYVIRYIDGSWQLL